MFHAVIPTPHFLPYASVSSPILCKSIDPSGQGRASIGVYAAGSGTLVLRPRGGPSDGSKDRTVTMVPGATIWVEFDTIQSGTATNIIIFWSR